jgi:hypothetical protein
MNYLLLSFLSFVVGIAVGLTGIGGASLITPMLIFMFQIPATVAVSSDIVAATLMKIVGGIKHWHQQTIELQVVKWLTLGSVPGALLGVEVLHLLKQVGELNLDALLLQLLGWTILLMTSVALMQLLLLTFVPQLRLPSLPKLELETHLGRALAMAIGAVLGSLVGLTSVSSGSMFALVLIACFRLDAQKLVGTDLTQAAILLSFTTLGHLSLGTVDWSLVLPIWFGSVPGVLVGAQLCEVAPQRPLRFLIYMLLVGVSWKLAHPL